MKAKKVTKKSTERAIVTAFMYGLSMDRIASEFQIDRGAVETAIRRAARAARRFSRFF